MRPHKTNVEEYYRLASFASRKHRQNKAQSENSIAGIFTFCPFAIASATDSIV
jgi:hypothetical protein